MLCCVSFVYLLKLCGLGVLVGWGMRLGLCSLWLVVVCVSLRLNLG